MAEAPLANTICPLNILFLDLANGLTEEDVDLMKNLLRGKQVSEPEMKELRSAWDVLHHLKNRGDIGGGNLHLLENLFSAMNKEPLKGKLIEFQRKHASTTDPVDNTTASVSSRGKDSNQTIEEGMLTGKVNVEVDENERQRQELDLNDIRLNQELKKQLLELVRKYVNSVPENDNAKLGECMDKLKEFGADLNGIKRKSLYFLLSFLTEEDLDYFWQKYKGGTVEMALSDILIPTDIRDKAEKAGITLRIKLEIDEKEYEEVKQKMHEISAVSTECRATSHRGTLCGKWEAFVTDLVQDKQHAKNLLQQSNINPVVDALRQEEFFFPSLVYFWFENSFTFPPTVTKATEYAVIHHAEMFCKENNVEVENLREIVKFRFNDIGKCLYDHITAENVGKVYPSWTDKSISNLESHFFGLLTKSDDYYTFQSKYVYSYVIATYFSNIVALSPNNIPMLLREEKTHILQTNLSYCFPYVTLILVEKALCFLKEVVKFSEKQTSGDIKDLGLVGYHLFESEVPSVFARDIEKVIGRNYTLDLSTCRAISNKTIHALSVILQYTSLIKDVKLYSESDEALLSSEFKECLTNIMADPSTVDSVKVIIKNSHDFTVTAKVLRILPLLHQGKQSRSISGTTQQLPCTLLTISSNENEFEEIEKCTIEMFIKALSFVPNLEKLSFTGFGKKLCEQFLLCLSEDTVILNINSLCLAGNELSWNHCRLLFDALSSMPCLTSLDLSRNHIGSLGCTLLLPIKNKIDVRVDDNSTCHGLLEILPLCSSTAELPDVGTLTLKSLNDVASLIKNLENVRHIDCTKLMASQLSKLCLNLTLLSNIVSIDLSRCELNQQIVLLLSERLKHLKDLKKVDISQCCGSTDDMKVLLQHIPQEVTDLNLSNTDMSGYLLDKLKRFRNLKRLNLSNSNLRANDNVFRFISTSITHLNLSENDLRGWNSENLKYYKQLAELDISYNKLNLVDIRNVLKCISTSITSLNVSHNDLKKMVESFDHLSKLQQLNLSNNGIQSCCNLSLPSSITHLNLSNNQITYIRHSLNHLSQLTHLDVSYNKVSQSLHDILNFLPRKARYLDFSSNCIDNVASVSNIISSFHDLQFINLGSNKFSDIGIQHLSNDVKSKRVKIGISHNFTLMPHVVDQMPTVSINLQLGNLRLSDVRSSCIYENLIHVTEVNVSRLSKENCSGICKSLILLTNLTKLVMTECYLKNDQNLTTSLNCLTGLKELDLSKNQLDSNIIYQIIRVLPPTLISLNLAHNKAKGDSSIKHLTKLQRLNLSNNNIKLPLHSFLLNVSETLKYLDISFNNIQNVDQVGKLISDFRQLCYINMNSNRVGAVGVKTLLSEIKSYNSNIDIDVSNTLCWLQQLIPCIANRLPTSVILPDFERKKLTLKDEDLQAFFKNISQITTVEIPKNVEWSETDYESVLNDLSIFSNIEHLTFASLNPAIFPFLSESLKNFRYLRHLDISGSRIDGHSVKVVGNTLLSLKRLEYINFSKTNIGMSEIEFLLYTHRRHINQPFINVAHNVHYLPAIFPYIEDQLSGSSIEGINFDFDELPVQSFANVVQIAKVTTLEVEEKQWIDKDFQSFVQGLIYLNLTILDLSYNNIGNNDANSLSEGMRSMDGLTHLYLSHNNIGDSGVKSLSEGMGSMNRLSVLALNGNSIGESGAKSLSEVISSLHRLTILCLGHNIIGDSGARSLSEVIRSTRRLTHLNLCQNNIGDSGAKYLSKGIRSVERLTRLLLCHNKIGDIGANSLSKVMTSMHLLIHFNLSHNNIGDNGAKKFNEVIRSMDGLTHIDLSHNNIADSVAKKLCEGMMPADRHFELDLRHRNIGDSGAKSWSKEMRSMRRLTYLDLCGNKIGESGSLSLTQGIKSMNGLTHLDLSHNNIGNSGAKMFREVMRSMQGLTYLNVSHNNIGDSGAKSLSEGMKSIDGLTHFDLSCNRIGEIDNSGAKLLSKVLRSMDELTHLDLSDNYIYDSDAKILSEAMRSMDGLTHLELRYNVIGDSGAKSLSEGMKSMYKLSHLDLSRNYIGDSGAKSLSEVIRSMSRLTYLDLARNSIGESGLKSLSEGMRLIYGLTHLDLSHNNIGDSGAKSFSEVLGLMDELTYLDLTYNNMGDSGEKSLGEVISSMHKLKYPYRHY